MASASRLTMAAEGFSPLGDLFNVESFQRVVSAKLSDKDILQAPSTTDKEVRIILRTGGKDFSCASSPSSAEPALVVGLALHRPTDTFVLFAFDRDSLPLRLVRFNRDGKTPCKRKNEQRKDVVPHLWSASDASVLLSAIEKCGGVGGGYLGANKDKKLHPEELPSLSAADRAECLRLVPRSEEDAGEIRNLILDHLLHPPGHTPFKPGFRHPDPNFLLPLAEAISSVLQRWRKQCRALPPAAKLPALPPPTADKDGRMEVELEGPVGGEPGTEERQEFDETMSKRNEQVKECVRLCKMILEKIKSLLKEVDAQERSSTFELGRVCVTSVVALSELQAQHQEDWSRNFPEALEYGCDLISVSENARGNHAFLDSWFDIANTNANVSGGGDCRSNSEVPDTIEGLSRNVIKGWLQDDSKTMETLKRVISMVESAMRSGTDQSLRKAAVDEIRSTLKILETAEEEQRKQSIVNVARLLKIWNAPCSDDEYDDFSEDAPSGRWSVEQMEGQMFFAQREVVGEEVAQFSFSVDHNNLAECLQDRLRELDFTSQSSDGDDGGDSYFRQEKRFEREWGKFVRPCLDNACAAAKKFLDAGDLRNSSLLVCTCCKFLCDPKTYATLKGWFNDPDESYGSIEIVFSHLKRTMEQLDIVAVKLVFQYHRDNGALGSGAHWLYNFLESGSLFFPNNPNKVSWSRNTKSYSYELRPHWTPEAHPAASVFSNGGWEHTLLRDALQGEMEAIGQWKDREAPVVLKERLSELKRQEKKGEAIAVARMMGGDHEALKLLVANGLANDAICQVNCSGNEKGLATLAYELRHTNPCASFLCMQALMLGLDQASHDERSGKSTDIDDALNTLTDLFISKMLVPVADKKDRSIVDGFCTPVPSLRLLSIMASTRAFLRVAKSTVEMQALLEKNSKIIGEHGVVLVVAALAVITHVASFDGLKRALERSGLLCEKSQNQNPSTLYSGLLTQYDSTPESPCEDLLKDICGALFACNEFLHENGRTVGCFQTALFPTVYLASRSGCVEFSQRILQLMSSCLTDEMHYYQKITPLSVLASCFSLMRLSKKASIKCSPLAKLLLETFLRHKPVESVPEDARVASVWMALAYAEFNESEEAAALLADHNFYSSQDRAYQYSGINTEKVHLDAFTKLLMSGNESDRMRHDTMSPYAWIGYRPRVKDSDRTKMCSVYLCRILGISSSKDEPLSPAVVAEYVRADMTMNSSFWRLDAPGVEARLSHLTGLAETLSEKASLQNTCRIMYFVDHLLQNGDTRSTPHFVLACGLSWLRTALMAKTLPAFDHTRDEFNSGWKSEDYLDDPSSMFEASGWEMNRNIRPYRSYAEHHFLDGKPAFAAYALIQAVERHALEARTVPLLSHICQEAVCLCAAMHFLLRPNTHRFKFLVEKFGSSELRKEIQWALQPKKILDYVLSPHWGTVSDFECRHTSSSSSRDDIRATTVACLIQRLCLAIQQGRVKEAAVLCVTGAQSNELWNELSNKSMYAPGLVTKVLRDLVQGCLLTLQGAVTSPNEVPKEFVNTAMYVILSMNWFRSCNRCSGSSEIDEYANKVISSIGNVKALHQCAAAWDKVDMSSVDVELRLCTQMTCCLSECCKAIEFLSSPRDGENSGEEKATSMCRYCMLIPEDYASYSDSEPGSDIALPDSPTNESGKRQRHTWSESDAPSTPDVLESSFKELQSCMELLHLKKARIWCDDALDRVRQFPSRSSTVNSNNVPKGKTRRKKTRR